MDHGAPIFGFHRDTTATRFAWTGSAGRSRRVAPPGTTSSAEKWRGSTFQRARLPVVGDESSHTTSFDPFHRRRCMNYKLTIALTLAPALLMGQQVSASASAQADASVNT